MPNRKTEQNILNCIVVVVVVTVVLVLVLVSLLLWSKMLTSGVLLDVYSRAIRSQPAAGVEHAT